MFLISRHTSGAFVLENLGFPASVFGQTRKRNQTGHSSCCKFVMMLFLFRHHSQQGKCLHNLPHIKQTHRNLDLFSISVLGIIQSTGLYARFECCSSVPRLADFVTRMAVSSIVYLS